MRDVIGLPSTVAVDPGSRRQDAPTRRLHHHDHEPVVIQLPTVPGTDGIRVLTAREAEPAVGADHQQTVIEHGIGVRGRRDRIRVVHPDEAFGG